MDTPSIDPEYFDSKILDHAIDGMAKPIKDNAAMIAKIQASDLPAEFHVTALKIQADSEKAMEQLVALRLATI